MSNRNSAASKLPSSFFSRGLQAPVDAPRMTTMIVGEEDGWPGHPTTEVYGEEDDSAVNDEG